MRRNSLNNDYRGKGYGREHIGLDESFCTMGTMRTTLTLVVERPNEHKFIRALRYIRILAPTPNGEEPIDTRIRFFMWFAFIMDMSSAICE